MFWIRNKENCTHLYTPVSLYIKVGYIRAQIFQGHVILIKMTVDLHPEEVCFCIYETKEGINYKVSRQLILTTLVLLDRMYSP